MKKITGTNNDGKKFRVLTSRIFNKDKPEQAIKKPPTIDNSVTNGPVKKSADKNFATK